MAHLYYFFSSLALLSAMMVIRSVNPIHSVLYLILVFFNVAGLLILLGLDFFAMIFLVVYVGAIAVLFLFVVMMLHIKYAEINEKKWRYLPIGGFLGILFLFELFLIVDTDTIPFLYSENLFFNDSIDSAFILNLQWSPLSNHWSNIQTIGYTLYTYYFFYFILASFILLVAMFGAIVLTMHKRVFILKQSVFLQNTREFAKTIGKK